MYDFIKNQWILGKYTATNIVKCVTKGYITQDKANEIMAMTQVIITTSST